MIAIDDYEYATLWEFIAKDDNEEIRPNSTDLMPFHKAIVAIIKHLYDNGKVVLKLPEFVESNYDFTKGFSSELQQFIRFEYNRYFNFLNVFVGFLEIEGITNKSIDFAEKRTPAFEFEIGVLESYSDDLPPNLINNLNKNLWYSRLLWARRVNEVIQNSDFSCYMDTAHDDYDKLDNYKFGLEYFVHYSGLILKKESEDGHDTITGKGVLLIGLTDDEQEASEDYKTASAWILQQYEKFPDYPPTFYGEKRNQQNFIDFAFEILRNPASAPEGKPLEITLDNLKTIWDNDLPSADECDWKSKGNKPKQVSGNKLIRKKQQIQLN